MCGLIRMEEKLTMVSKSIRAYIYFEPSGIKWKCASSIHQPVHQPVHPATLTGAPGLLQIRRGLLGAFHWGVGHIRVCMNTSAHRSTSD